VVSEAERPLLVDVERTRDSLRGFIGDVKIMPGEKYCELIAEARIDGAALMRRCLNAKGNKSGSGARYISRLPSCDCRWRPDLAAQR
jgi:hypothetical protein